MSDGTDSYTVRVEGLCERVDQHRHHCDKTAAWWEAQAGVLATLARDLLAKWDSERERADEAEGQLAYDRSAWAEIWSAERNELSARADAAEQRLAEVEAERDRLHDLCEAKAKAEGSWFCEVVEPCPRCAELEAERDQWRNVATRNNEHCPTCDGGGIMDVVVGVLPPDEREEYEVVPCAECGGTGRSPCPRCALLRPLVAGALEWRGDDPTIRVAPNERALLAAVDALPPDVKRWAKGGEGE